jgi:serine/threonine protein phosphatase PrpC
LKTKLQSVARTHKGLIREQNEDNFILGLISNAGEWHVPHSEIELGQDAFIFCVADGMGGEKAGEIASEVAVQGIQQYITESLANTENGGDKNLANAALLFAHNSIKKVVQENPDQIGMGTTAAVGILQQSVLQISWVGDSRVYRYSTYGKITDNKFGYGNLELLIDDHSKVWDMVLQGQLTPEEARLHPESNVITQSLGDVFRTPQPDSINIPVCKDDVYLACTDGLNTMLSDAEISECFEQFGDNLGQLADVLIDRANQKGGVDNITLVLLRITQGETYNPTMMIQKKASVNSAAKTLSIERTSWLKYIFASIVLIIVLMSFYFFKKSQNKIQVQNQSAQIIQCDSIAPVDTSEFNTDFDLNDVKDVVEEKKSLKPGDVYDQKVLDSLNFLILKGIQYSEQNILIIDTTKIRSGVLDTLKDELKAIRLDYQNAKSTKFSLEKILNRVLALEDKIRKKIPVAENKRKRKIRK